MENISQTLYKDIVIVFVNLVRATFKEADELKKLLEENIAAGYIKIVVDISQCLYFDSTFLGVMVYTLKEISKKGGDLRVVKSDSIIKTLMAKVGALHIFNLYDTIDEAVLSFESSGVINHFNILENPIEN